MRVLIRHTCWQYAKVGVHICDKYVYDGFWTECKSGRKVVETRNDKPAVMGNHATRRVICPLFVRLLSDIRVEIKLKSKKEKKKRGGGVL